MSPVSGKGVGRRSFYQKALVSEILNHLYLATHPPERKR